MFDIQVIIDNFIVLVFYNLSPILWIILIIIWVQSTFELNLRQK